MGKLKSKWLIFIIIIVVAGTIASYLGYLSIPERYAIEVLDSYCSEGVVHIKIKNKGYREIIYNDIIVWRISPEIEPDTPVKCCSDHIAPGESAWHIDPTCGTGNICTYRLSGLVPMKTPDDDIVVDCTK